MSRSLDAHLVICGFPRSGSTLLQVLIETCVRDVYSFKGEVEGRWAAEHANRRHRWMLTKRPRDIEEVDRLRSWYASNPGRLAVVLPIRDPRDVLTSVHAGYPPSRGYYCEIERWRDCYRAITEIEHDDDVTIVRYEDLLLHTTEVEHHLTGHFGWDLTVPFERFHQEAAATSDLPTIDQGALGGRIRALDAQPPNRWQDDQHVERLRRVIDEAPEVFEALDRWGYADDHAWTERL